MWAVDGKQRIYLEWPYLLLIYGKLLLFHWSLPYPLSTNRDLCAFNMLVCLTPVSLFFSVISIPMLCLILKLFYTIVNDQQKSHLLGYFQADGAHGWFASIKLSEVN